MKRILLVIMAGLLMSGSAFGWGREGHETIAKIAENNLKPSARKVIEKYLGDHSIVYYAKWMDEYRHTPEYAFTTKWHVARVDENLEYSPYPEAGDAISGINQAVEILKDYKTLPDSTVAVNIKYLLHLVGDMHCPMHAGRLSDLGGNKTKVKWFGQNTNLHSVWDSKMIDAARKWSYSEWVEQLDRTDRKFRKSVMRGTYEEWFKETVEGAASIYEYVERMEKENPNLSYQFVYDFSPLLEDRLLVGGYRLAYVLNSIFG